MKNLNNVLNQNINVTKQERFATFTFSIIDNFLAVKVEEHNPITIMP